MTKIITGFHAIEERVKSLEKSQNSQNISIYYSKIGPRVKKILAFAKNAGVKASQVPDSKLDELVSGLDETLQDHRGIVMEIRGEQKKSANLVDFDAWIKAHSENGGALRGGSSAKAAAGVEAADTGAGVVSGTNQDSPAPLTVVILDKVTDPHNVGAIIRSCDQFGASLVVLPEHKAASDIGENEIIARASAGASAWVPVAVVNNLVRAAEQLKEAGFWLYGADAGGETCGKINFAQKSAIVMGSEGTGISKLLGEKCDTIVSIPTCGKIDSLNVSVAAGVLLYEVYRRTL